MSGIKIKVTMKTELPDLMKTFYDNGVGERLGQLMKDEVIDSVSQGISPVRGEGRFEAYKNPKKYPGKRKSSRPVNLSLDGSMLGAIAYSVNRAAQTLTFGYIYGGRNKLKAETHNEGTQVAKGIPQRKFIPTGETEEFIVSIQRKIVDFYKARLSDIIALSNRR